MAITASGDQGVFDNSSHPLVNVSLGIPPGTEFSVDCGMLLPSFVCRLVIPKRLRVGQDRGELFSNIRDSVCLSLTERRSGLDDRRHHADNGFDGRLNTVVALLGADERARFLLDFVTPSERPVGVRAGKGVNGDLRISVGISVKRRRDQFRLFEFGHLLTRIPCFKRRRVRLRFAPSASV